MSVFASRHHFFLLLLALVTIAFGWVLLPYAGAIFWATVLAILFTPLHRRLLDASGRRKTLAALATLISIVVAVLIPTALIGAALLDQAGGVYDMVTTGQVDFAAHFQRILRALPGWAVRLLDDNDLLNLAAIQQRLSESAAQFSRGAAGYALHAGRNTFDFLLQAAIMLYLLFFFLRDGGPMAARIGAAVPLSGHHKQRLLNKFTVVIRATVKGNMLVALAQGALGGLAYWFLGIHAPLLWAVVTAFLSLLPAIGAAAVWGPIALFLLLNDQTWQALLLIAYGVFLIGTVDNILRPLLVGKDTRMPDYLVLLSTIGGLSLFGLSGFVIGPVIAALFLSAWDLFATDAEASA